MRRKWTRYEVQYLLQNYPYVTYDEMCEHLNRSKNSIKRKWDNIKPDKSIKKIREIHPYLSEEDMINKLDFKVNDYYPIYHSDYNGIHKKCLWVCPKCLKTFDRRPTDVIHKKCILCFDCGHSIGHRKNMLSDKYVKDFLLNLGFIPLFDEYIGARKKIKLQCFCGNIFMCSYNSIQSGNTTRCPKCKKCISNIVKNDLVPLMQKILNTNYNILDIIECKIDGWVGAIDILIDKIAIEYDGYYWHRVHQNTSKVEKKKEEIIINNGYKLLRIRSDGTDIPNEKQIKYAIQKLYDGYNKWTITMNSWKLISEKDKKNLR